MDVLYRARKATVAEVRAAMSDPPSYSAVRAMLRILEGKGHVWHEQNGPRYVYRPRVAREQAKRSALKHLLHTFFEGSMSEVVAALFEISPQGHDERELARVKRLIDQARAQAK
jgi:BlaI family penicillinase repressor